MRTKLLQSVGICILLVSILTSCSTDKIVAVDSASSVGDQMSPYNSASIVRCNASSQEGYYHSDIYYGEGASICYLDYETMQDVVLCSSPNCTHDSNTCPAFYPFDGRTLLGGVRVVGDTLLALQTVSGENTMPHIDRLGLDGSYQKCLAEFGVNQQLPGDIETDYYTDGSCLYFVLNDVNQKTAKRSGRVVSVSLSSGEVHTVYESPEAVTQLKIFTAFDRSLVLYEVQVKSLSDISERFFVRNIDTEEEREINWRSDDTTATMANGRYLWTVDETAQTLIRCDMVSDDTRQYSLADLCGQVQQQYGSIFDIYVSPLSFTDEACFLEFSVPNEEGNRNPVFYTFQLSDGIFTPFSLFMTFNQTIIPVFGQTPHGLLVQKDWLPVSSGYGEIYLPQWALILPENYLRSTPEWIATGHMDLAS